ncbi:hypothetical protein CVT25_015897 [Psilocybe cyanescens]|uniref:Uncharacterized protein n=1 Tax=Psilocybe cyanescens TaxID=93625 RepID=A0A409WSC6_PSICY|nr:hypothetical protein CVT25_015897 [Psilocybe cyanescens]
MTIFIVRSYFRVQRENRRKKKRVFNLISHCTASTPPSPPFPPTYTTQYKPKNGVPTPLANLPAHVLHHRVAIPAPLAEVHDPDGVEALPALSARQQSARAREARPFNFLVRGTEVLRTSLSEWCTENGVGEEETLETEYIESVMPLQKMSDYPHEDWVSAVSCFITASYDGHLRVFDYSKKLRADHLAVHRAFDVDADDGEGETAHTIATAPQDLTAQLPRVTLGTSPSTSSSLSSSKAKTEALATIHLHTALITAITAITAILSGARLLTAGWDGLIGVWDAGVPERDEGDEGVGMEEEEEKTERERE